MPPFFVSRYAKERTETARCASIHRHPSRENSRPNPVPVSPKVGMSAARLSAQSRRGCAGETWVPGRKLVMRSHHGMENALQPRTTNLEVQCCVCPQRLPQWTVPGETAPAAAAECAKGAWGLWGPLPRSVQLLHRRLSSKRLLRGSCPWRRRHWTTGPCPAPPYPVLRRREPHPTTWTSLSSLSLSLLLGVPLGGLFPLVLLALSPA